MASIAAADGSPSNSLELPAPPRRRTRTVDAAGAAVRREDHLPLGNSVALGELPVALVVRRHRHHRARPVAHQHEVGGEDRDPFAGHWMDCVDAQRLTLLLHRLQLRLRRPAGAALLDERRERGAVLGGPQGQRVLGGDRDVGHPHQRVRPRGEHRQLFIGALDAEVELDAFGAADPVALHRANLLRPASIRSSSSSSSSA